MSFVLCLKTFLWSWDRINKRKLYPYHWWYKLYKVKSLMLLCHNQMRIEYSKSKYDYECNVPTGYYIYSIPKCPLCSWIPLKVWNQSDRRFSWISSLCYWIRLYEIHKNLKCYLMYFFTLYLSYFCLSGNYSFPWGKCSRLLSAYRSDSWRPLSRPQFGIFSSSRNFCLLSPRSWSTSITRYCFTWNIKNNYFWSNAFLRNHL